MIPAKEKAAQLVAKFKPHVYCFLGSGMLTNTYNEVVATMNAKLCARIHIDELLLLDHDTVSWEYYQDVKTEIELVQPSDEQ